MTPDQERWAEALQIEQMLGESAPAWIAAQIDGLVLAGDEAGVTRFRGIARRLDKLRGGELPS